MLGNPLLLTRAESTARAKGHPIERYFAATYVILDAAKRARDASAAAADATSAKEGNGSSNNISSSGSGATSGVRTKQKNQQRRAKRQERGLRGHPDTGGVLARAGGAAAGWGVSHDEDPHSSGALEPDDGRLGGASKRGLVDAQNKRQHPLGDAKKSGLSGEEEPTVFIGATSATRATRSGLENSHGGSAAERAVAGSCVAQGSATAAAGGGDADVKRQAAGCGGGGGGGDGDGGAFYSGGGTVNGRRKQNDRSSGNEDISDGGGGDRGGGGSRSARTFSGVSRGNSRSSSGAASGGPGASVGSVETDCAPALTAAEGRDQSTSATTLRMDVRGVGAGSGGSEDKGGDEDDDASSVGVDRDRGEDGGVLAGDQASIYSGRDDGDEVGCVLV